MSDASPTPNDPFDTPEKAYAEAERLIAKANDTGEELLTVELRYLERLPPSIAACTALQGLSLTGTRVADLAPLAGLTALQSLWLEGTQVADLALLAGLTALQSLWLDRTHVADLAPLAGLSALQRLSLDRTRVADLAPLAGLTALQHLSLDGTQVADLAPLAGLTALQNLWLDDTHVAELAPLAGLTALQSLSLDGTRVAKLAPLAGLTAVRHLSLDGSRVSDLAPLAGLTALQHLWLDGTRVADLAPLAGLTALRHLRLDGTQVADLAPLAGLTALQNLWLEGTHVAELAPLAGLTALQSLRLDGTRVANLAPLAGSTALQHLRLDGTRVGDLAPLAGLAAMIDAVVKAWSDEKRPWRRKVVGLYFQNTKASERDPFKGFAALDDPHRTIETINYLRRQQGLPEHVPAAGGTERETQDALQRILQEPPSNIGARFEPTDHQLRMQPVGSADDAEVAAQPRTQQLQLEVRRKALAFSNVAFKLDNTIGWSGIGKSAKAFSDLVALECHIVAGDLATLWGLAVELGSFLEQDIDLRTNGGGNASPLDPEVRRPLADLVRTAAPWVRRFPSAQQLDDEAGAFLARTEYLEPARHIFDRAGEQELISEADRRALIALVEAAKRGEFQGQKATARSHGSARNLVLAGMTSLAGFYLGAAQNNFATDSVIAKKASEVMLSAEKQVLGLFNDSPPDMKQAVALLLKKLREDEERRKEREMPIRLALPHRRRDENE